MSNENIDFRNFFNNLINTQILQTNFNNSFGKNKQTPITELNNSNKITPNTQTSSVFDNLSSLLSGTQGESQGYDLLLTINKLLQAGANIDNIANLLTSLSEDDGDILYTRTGSNDPTITVENKIKYLGGDLKNFLTQAKKIADNNGDINAYIDTVSRILSEGDYDDLRRFIDVTNDTINSNYNLNDLFEFTQEVVGEDPENIESNLFAVQTLFEHGSNLDNALEIMRNMDTQGYDGNMNISILNETLVEASKIGEDIPSMIQNMADSGDTMWFINAWASANNLRIIKEQLDFQRFKKIEFMDKKKTLVIHQGDNIALHAKAISSTEGTLSDSLLYWSSVQDGQLAKGTSYLDLSKLDKGTYDIYVKIGDYDGGTDTAKRKVVVVGKDEEIKDEDDNKVHECKKRGKNFGKSKDGIVITAKVYGNYSKGEVSFNSDGTCFDDNSAYNDSSNVSVSSNPIKNTKDAEKNLNEKKSSIEAEDKEKQEYLKEINKEATQNYLKNKEEVNAENDKAYFKTQENYKESQETFNRKKIEEQEIKSNKEIVNKQNEKVKIL